MEQRIGQRLLCFVLSCVRIWRKQNCCRVSALQQAILSGLKFSEVPQGKITKTPISVSVYRMLLWFCSLVLVHNTECINIP